MAKHKRNLHDASSSENFTGLMSSYVTVSAPPGGDGLGRPDVGSPTVVSTPQSVVNTPQMTDAGDTVPDPARFAEALSAGMGLYDAMRAAGYSESSARMGKLALSKRMLGELGKMGKWYAEIGRELDAELVEDMIAGRTYVNALSGTGKEANEALKLLGNMSRFKVFEPENQQQVLVVQAPAGWLEMTGLAKQLPQQQISSSPQPKQLEGECGTSGDESFPQAAQTDSK